MRDIWTSGSAWRRTVVGLAALVGLTLILSGCGGGQVAGGGSGNPLPTPRPAEDVGSEAKSAARDSYQATWDSYLRDSIAAENQLEEVKLALLQRYEKPGITEQNVGGLLKQTDLVEDKTKFNVSANNMASAMAEFDVKLTFLNGDTDTRTCRWQVAIEMNQEDKLWYVINPSPLAVLSNCGR